MHFPRPILGSSAPSAHAAHAVCSLGHVCSYAQLHVQLWIMHLQDFAPHNDNQYHVTCTQVDGCHESLRQLKEYHQRYKICEYHLKVPSIIREGVRQRFCQQCGRFHDIGEFDGDKRSCRARLQVRTSHALADTAAWLMWDRRAAAVLLLVVSGGGMIS